MLIIFYYKSIYDFPHFADVFCHNRLWLFRDPRRDSRIAPMVAPCLLIFTFLVIPSTNSTRLLCMSYLRRICECLVLYSWGVYRVWQLRVVSNIQEHSDLVAKHIWVNQLLIVKYCLPEMDLDWGLMTPPKKEGPLVLDTKIFYPGPLAIHSTGYSKWEICTSPYLM